MAGQHPLRGQVGLEAVVLVLLGHQLTDRQILVAVVEGQAVPIRRRRVDLDS